jgi:hypothetical protein
MPISKRYDLRRISQSGYADSLCQPRIGTDCSQLFIWDDGKRSMVTAEHEY